MTVDIARAWKDPEYRKSLTPEELASLPPNPAGTAELTEEELGDAVGGKGGLGGLVTNPIVGCSSPNYCGGAV